ncbi:MAG TPA: helix-turn-helix transcriptional regulator [Isosphaeraceae bacterium]|nr:helix-turn-helix transcriptional regulator [Isosphaeraceae bacterium]
MSTMREPFSSLLRRAILESGLTRYAISVKSGVNQAALSRFVAGKRSLNLESVDKLVEVLGLEVRMPRKRKDG